MPTPDTPLPEGWTAQRAVQCWYAWRVETFLHTSPRCPSCGHGFRRYGEPVWCEIRLWNDGTTTIDGTLLSEHQAPAVLAHLKARMKEGEHGNA